MNRSRGRRSWLEAGLVAAIALGVFSPTLGHEFVWDDLMLIRDSPFYGSAGLGQVWGYSYWQTPPGERPKHRALYYRPVVSTSYWADWKLADGLPWAFHLSNVLAHALCAVLVLLAGRRLLGDGLAALLAACLFALHPAHTEVVAFISGRADLWLTMFLLASILVLDDGPRSRVRGWLGCLLMAGAALSKEVGFLAPALWLVWCWGRTRESWPALLRSRFGWLAAQGSLLAAVLAIRLALFRGLIGTESGSGQAYTLAERVWLVILTVGDYLERLVWPLPHVAYLDLDPSDLGLSMHALVATTALILFATLVWTGRRRSGVVVGASWILIALFPVMNLVPVPSSYLSERLLYLPTVGFVWMVAGFVVDSGASWRRPLVIIVSIVCVLSAIDIMHRSRVWRDTETFFLQMIADSPGLVLGYNNLADYYRAEGQPERALPLAEKAVRLAPQLATAWSVLGQIRHSLGLGDEAVAAAARAASLDPSKPHYHQVLAVIANDTRRPNLALSASQQAVSLAPDEILGWNELARANGVLGDFDAAAAASRRAIELDPDYLPALINLGVAELLRGDPAAAEIALRAALEREPGAVMAVTNLAHALAQQGRAEQADAVLAEWLERFPRSAARGGIEAVRREIADSIREPR